MDKSEIMGLARHILTTAGGVLASKGVIGESDIELLVGAIITIAGVVWSVMQKRGKAA